MRVWDIVVVGGGPAGLCAAIEAAKNGARVLLIDENSRPGGQLFKQIHKFFGSAEHKAGVRGLEIGLQLLKETKELGMDVWLNSKVCGIYDDNVLWVVKDERKSFQVKGAAVILCTGAVENSISFEGWTLPGVMGAGAAQTMINVNRVLPGRKVLMVGSGNVGVIVSYQLLQAGAEVAAIVEAAPRLGAYGVHTAKVRRAGVPFYVSHTIVRAEGDGKVERAIIARVDERFKPVDGSEIAINVDTICLATGLTPLAELAWIAGCKFVFNRVLGGHVPWHDRYMATSKKGIYIAGDITGIEEASTAMEEGRLAGVSAAAAIGLIDTERLEKIAGEIWERLDALRCGPFGENRKIAKQQVMAGGDEQ
ncbi:MAG: Sarcosine oxidase alpha subunit [Firmicutes bacterium]|nr:Sarcosine oxidase alpha subunit [Bacillota bacterium]MDI6707381.1 FAD-dependent oxidoreductase [Bacillota bacterium]